MARARGANALLHTAFQATLGTVPSAGATWFRQPFVSTTMGEERGLLESDLLGLGREMSDPTLDVASNVGDMVVPVDVENFGRWLKLAMGAPTTTGTGPYEHVFASGATTLPLMVVEVGNPEIPTFAKHLNCRLNQMRIAMQRQGLLNATCALIATEEAAGASTSGAGSSPTILGVSRFAQATGSVKKNTTQLAGVVAAELTISNNLDPVETIKADGRIEDSDPGMFTASGSITVRFQDTSLLTAATDGTPCALEFGWTFGTSSLIFNLPRVYLPRVKRPIEGPRGIQATFNWQASGAASGALTATLTNGVESYA